MQGIGEPLLNRDLAAMICYLKQRGVYVVFNTNATLLTDRRQAELIESGLDELHISLDGSTAETYRQIRGIAAFERVIANVSGMVRMRHQMGAANPQIAFWMTGMRSNLAELPDVIELAARIGVNEVYLQRLTYWGEGLAVAEQSIYEGYPEAEAIVAEAERRAEQLGVRLRGAGAVAPRGNLVGCMPQPEPWRACSRPLRLAYVTAQGNALPCCIAPFTDAPYEEIKLGNYLRDGVQAVWNSERYTRFRQQLASANPPPSCRNCGVAWSL
jgi:radical SAM protein with 4Fe4S-binding SPASM domain